MRKRSKKYWFIYVIIVSLLISFGTAGEADASVYTSYKKQVTVLSKGIRNEIKMGGVPLPKGVEITKKDKAEWEKAEKKLRAGKYGDKYDFIFSRGFSKERQVYGFVDTVVGTKYRYLELLDINRSVSKPYRAFAEATKNNKYTLDYYIKNQKKMYKKLDSIYKKEIAPYKTKNTPTKIAIAATVVANYYKYDGKGITNNLAYTINTKKGVCSDYAFMLDYFLRKMGYKTRLIGLWEKFAIDDSYGWHSVNAVRIGGEWFFIDSTNMDAGKYAIFRKDDNVWFSSELDYLTFPGWGIRCVY